jgi:hypothetical protein
MTDLPLCYVNPLDKSLIFPVGTFLYAYMACFQSMSIINKRVSNYCIFMHYKCRLEFSHHNGLFTFKIFHCTQVVHQTEVDTTAKKTWSPEEMDRMVLTMAAVQQVLAMRVPRETVETIRLKSPHLLDPLYGSIVQVMRAKKSLAEWTLFAMHRNVYIWFFIYFISIGNRATLKIILRNQDHHPLAPPLTFTGMRSEMLSVRMYNYLLTFLREVACLVEEVDPRMVWFEDTPRRTQALLEICCPRHFHRTRP